MISYSTQLIGKTDTKEIPSESREEIPPRHSSLQNNKKNPGRRLPRTLLADAEQPLQEFWSPFELWKQDTRIQWDHRKDITFEIAKKPGDNIRELREDTSESGKPDHAKMIAISPENFGTSSENVGDIDKSKISPRTDQILRKTVQIGYYQEARERKYPRCWTTPCKKTNRADSNRNIQTRITMGG